MISRTSLILFFGFCFLTFQSTGAQILNQKMKEYEKNKIQIFTVNERDNLLSWFDEGVVSMNWTEDKKDEYYSILLYYFVKMARLDDKDKGNSKEEVIIKMDEILIKQDMEIKEVLTKEEYEKHQKNYKTLLTTIRTRISETDYKN